MARPTVVTPEVVIKLEQAFAIDATVEEACSYADISRNTFYEYLKKQPEFQDRIDELRQKPVLKARKTIVDNLETPDHAKWFLARKRKAEFSERIEQTGAEGKDLHPDVSEEIKAITKQLNELYRNPSSPSDGGTASPLGTEAQDKE